MFHFLLFNKFSLHYKLQTLHAYLVLSLTAQINGMDEV